MAIFNLYINQQETNPVGGENIISGSLVYLAPDGKWYNTTATDKTKSTTELKLAITNSISEDEIEFISYGEYVYPTGTLVAGAKYYVSVLPGQITNTQYNNSTNVIRYVGTAKDTAVLLFNPDQTYISDYNSKVNDIIIQASNEIDNSHTHLEEDISDLDKYTMNEVDILTDGLGWKLNVDSIFKSKITNDNIVNFVGGTGITLSHSEIDNAITIDSSGGVIPNLQQVTDAGNTTTTSMIIENFGSSLRVGQTAANFAFLNYDGQVYSVANNVGNKYISLDSLNNRIYARVGTTFQTNLVFTAATAERTQTFPDKSGTFAMTSDLLQTVTTSAGIDVTGTLQNFNIALDFTDVAVGGTLVGTDYLMADNGTLNSRQLISSIPLSIFNNDLGIGYTHPAYTTRNITTSGAQVLSTFTSDAIGSVTNITTRSISTTDIGAEPALGNPSVSGYILSSTTGGVRSWIAPASGGATNLTTTHGTTSVTINSDTGTDAVINGVTGTTAGVVTTGIQTIAGVKTFVNDLNLLNASIVVTGGQISAQGDIDTNGFFVVNNTSGGYKITGKGADDILLASGGTTSLAAIGGGGGATNLTTTYAATTVTINSDTGTDATINGATTTLAGVVTNGAQTFAGVKTFNNTIVANSFVRSGDTNVQFLMAGGGVVIGGSGISVDATSVKLGALTSNWNAGSIYSITAADFIGSSDKKLKENIKLLHPKNIKSVYKSFNFKTNKQPRVGVIAQELEIEHPEFVRTDEQGMKSVSYSDLHSAEIAYLKDKVEQLETMLLLLLKK